MLFTAGHIRSVYKLFVKAQRRGEPPLRAGRRLEPAPHSSSPYPGPLVFRSLADTEEYITQNGMLGWGPFVLQGQWERDTYLDEYGDRRLLNNCFMFAIKGYDYNSLLSVEDLM